MFCLYGVIEVVILVVGYVFVIGFIYLGKFLFFVYDMVDIVKFEFVVLEVFKIVLKYF